MKKWKIIKKINPDLEDKNLGYKIGYLCGSICIISLIILITSLISIGSCKLIFLLLKL